MMKKIISVFFAMVLWMSATVMVKADVNIGDVTKGWYWPLENNTEISSGFGWRSFNGGEWHQGIDIPAETGTPIFAARDGDVYETGNHSSMGYYICIYHGLSNGQQIFTTYMHMNGPAYYSKGQSVSHNTQIGVVGSTGLSTGSHLHFHISHPNGAWVPSPSHKTESELYSHYVDPTPGAINYTYRNGAVSKTNNSSGSEASSLTIDLTDYPQSINVGSGYGLRGTISSNYNIKKVTGQIKQGSKVIQSSKDEPNSTSLNIRSANLNNKLLFNKLSAGSYTLYIEAVDSSGTKKHISKDFKVNAKEKKKAASSTLAINLEKYPVSLDQGSGFGLRGSVSSNYNISVVRGYVKNSSGKTVLSSTDNPNSKSMDIRTARLNNDLVFNNLSAGNYTMIVEAKDSSGSVVTAKKDFSVKAKDSGSSASSAKPSGSSVTGMVNIPSSWDNLSIRSGPGTSYEIVGSMNQGAKCTVYPDKESNGWYYVKYNGVTGYASGKQIVLGSSSSGSSAQNTENTRTGVVNIPSSWDNLSIRSGPGTSYEIVGSMNQGAKCTVYPDKESNGWYYVKYNGVTGYASGKQINLQ